MCRIWFWVMRCTFMLEMEDKVLKWEGKKTRYLQSVICKREGISEELWRVDSMILCRKTHQCTIHRQTKFHLLHQQVIWWIATKEIRCDHALQGNHHTKRFVWSKTIVKFLSFTSFPMAQSTESFFTTVNQMFGGSSQLPTTAECVVIKLLCTV